ncbi:YaiI/YqxD family protein [Kordiimonas laminariae]|uniref:YaiI/YqxD family protein n=1 Tax=Kordiimonas laminariae TaxID=2917717 RepID=UPI001FF61751|nr:YaiI/YqxD family protein [Kordiimonas laminariae]MCK0068688.1 YaiI/YqxD family protein [Kordiimonas laminariae]
MLEVFVDADACPVKEEVLKVAYRHDLVVHLVSNQWLRLPVGPKINKVVVSEGFDAADDWIAEKAGDGDICITGDILLASRCLEKGATVIGHGGKPFTEDNIGMAIAMRELKSQLRDMGEDKGYNASFTGKDRSRFLSALESWAQEQLRKQH